MSIIALVSLALSLLSLFIAFSAIRVAARQRRQNPSLQVSEVLQSKIAILEDLGNRTESQFDQISKLLDQKAAQMRGKMLEAESHIRRIEQSMQKSLEVAEIFQDRIPHEDIVQRQNTIKYVKAAQMAHQGESIDRIAEEVDLPSSELAMIAKVNRNQLMFDEKQLPAWAKVKNLGGKIIESAGSILKGEGEPAVAPEPIESQPAADKDAIRRVEFPRIGLDITKNLR